MSKYEEFSSVKVVLEDVLEYLDELRETVASKVLRGDSEATDAAIRQWIGEVHGLDLVIARLQLNFGAEPINEYMPDTLY